MKINNPKKTIEKLLCMKEYDSVIQMFLNSACKNPRQFAICTRDQQYTYQDLLAYVESAVEDLTKQGVKKGDAVGLHGKCNFHFIGYFLACLTLGIVSVFIDHDLPKVRKVFMLEKAASKFVINFTSESDQLFVNEIQPSASIISYNNENQLLTNCIKKIKFYDPAYIFFTSGSTGTPKGVVGCHGGLDHFVHWQRTEFNINETDRVAQITALSFDVILREILLPLTSGASLWIPSAMESAYPQNMLTWMIDKQITVIHTVPTMLRTWMQLKQPTRKNKLRYLFSAGEPLLANVVESWRKQFDLHIEIINLYGPTETTLAKCYYRLPDQLLEGVQPIGQPMDGAEVFIMAPDQTLCAQEEIGEIVIRTPYRSLGYLDSNSNKVVFQKNKYTKDDNDLLYFTGDLGFFDHNQTLRIVGRRDNQVKINGVRIELGEIEKKLYAHCDVLHAVVVAYEKENIKTLIAAVTLKQTISTVVLVNYLQAVLPQTHLPSRIVILKSIPLTNSGKVSKTEFLKLLAKEKTSRVCIDNFSDNEKQIADIWKRVLGVGEFDADTHILSLGCSSLQAMSIANLLYDTFGCLVTYKTLIDYPTICALAMHIEALPVVKNETYSVVKSDTVCSEYPLSSTQKRFWIMNQNEFIPSELYNVYMVFSLNGNLNIEKLKSAINTLVYRHCILQCVISDNNLEPKHCVGTVLPHLKMLTVAESENVESIIKSIVSTPIDLENGPLTQFYLVLDSHNKMTLVINQHHIISDDISLSHLITELNDLYNEIDKEKSPFDFLDYNLREKINVNNAFEYWKTQLTDYSDIRLPTQSLRSPIFDYQGERLIYPLSEHTIQKIKTFAKQINHSEFTVFFSAFYILLMQYSGQQDFVIGLPVSSRISSKVESLLGCFINMLPIKVNSDSEKLLSELLKEVNTLILSGYENQDYSFEKIMDAIDIQHDLSKTPLYQVIFNMQPVNHANTLKLGDVKATYLDVGNNTTKTDITWTIKQSETQYYLCIDYAFGLFSANYIKQLAQSYAVLLINMCEGLSHPIGNLSLFSNNEKQRYFSSNIMPVHHYQKKHDYLYSPFIEQAKLHPDVIAVKAGDGLFRYDELLTASTCLAVTLQQYDVKPNQLVAIYLPKSKYQVVAAIGIMMSGAAYLPISSDEAVDRFAHILQQAEVNVVITTKALSKTVPNFHTVIEIDDENSWSFCNSTSLQLKHQSDDLAYVIFTSGSTGTPKGVMIEHKAALNTIQDINERYRIDSQDRVYGISNLNFDLSVYDIFGTLAAGACLILPKNEDAKEPAAWIKAIADEHITIWNTVPALMQMLTDYAKSSVIGSLLSSIRLVLLSGDWISLQLPNAIWQVCGRETQIISLGGATESSIWSILYPIKFISSDWKSIPYGRSMWNQQFYILNAHLDPVPTGVIGALYIGGVGLARGYWKDSEKTSEHFFNHPLTGERLYRTGDLGRYQSDGVIEFLGRMDHQVKIRGYRIELGEIESQLNQYDGIERSVVIEKEGNLCAYIKSAYPLCIKTVLADLKNKLPAYMLPNSFYQVENFSLTANGKVNINELHHITLKNLESTDEMPLNDTEKRVSDAWMSVLNVNDITRHDNFFSLGGHSLKALEVILYLKNKFDYEINLKTLFLNPVLYDFANAINDSVNHTVEKNTSLTLRKFSDKAIYPLSHTQSRLWFLEKMLSDKRVYTVSALYKIEGQLKQSIFNKALSLLSQEQSMLRAVFIDEESGKQKILPQFYPEVILIDWSSRKNIQNNRNDIKQFSESIVQNGFNFSNTPLWNVYQIKLSDFSSYFLFIFHHLIVDGMSLDLFFQSLSEKYNAILKNESEKTTTFSFNYMDYIQSLDLHENQAIMQDHLAYWKNKLEGFKNYRLTLPTEKQRPHQFSFKGSNITFEIADFEKVKKIDLIAKKINCTRSTIFLGLYHLLLFYLSGQNTILTGQMLLNRNNLNLRHIIGYFANTVVAQSHIQVEQRFSDYIHALQQDLLRDLSHQEVPFELLIKELSLAIDASAAPLFQHMFVYQQLENRQLNLNGIASKRLSYDSESAKFDLTFFVEDFRDSIQGKFEYYADIFSEKIISGFICGFQVLLDSVIHNFNIALSELNIINSDDHEKLKKWNETDHVFDKKYDYLYDPFVEQAVLMPSNIAVEASDGCYRYDELLSAAQSFAFKLQDLGAKPNTLIAIYLPKSKYQVVAALGVMMSGAAYLPIASEEAPERLLEILNQGDVTIVLTCDQLIPKLKHVNATIIDLTNETSWFVKLHGKLITLHQKTDLAYVIFTSGSTGVPKGVMIEHHAALNTIQDINERYAVSHKDRIYGLSNLNFDLSVYDMFGTLAAGGTLILPAEEARKDPSIWLNDIKHYGITIWNSVPALMKMFCDYALPERPSNFFYNIRLVLLSGDWIPLRLPQQIHTLCGEHTTIISLGGATESSIWSILYPIQKIAADWKSIPYGFPMWNQRFYILNQQMDFVPQGVVGELYIAGEGLARGYWQDSEKTITSFINHPKTGERIYRTGDLGRYNENGIIEFLGRIDSQVKINGYRVELGEIKNQLEKFELIERALVIEQDGKLLAFVISKNKIDSDSILEKLKNKLPDYMLPTQLQQLEKIPLTENGKIDLKKLPKIKQIGNKLFKPLRTELEKIVAKTWSKVLNVKEIGLNDNFFSLGGHSLLAIEAINLLKTEINISLPLRIIFESKNLSNFAELVEKTKNFNPVLNKRNVHSVYLEGEI